MEPPNRHLCVGVCVFGSPLLVLKGLGKEANHFWGTLPQFSETRLLGDILLGPR